MKRLQTTSCVRNEGASGDVDENKGDRKEGVRSPVPGISCSVFAIGLPHPDCGCSAIAKMKVHPGMLMKTKERQKKVSGARCQVSGRVRKTVDFRGRIFLLDLVKPSNVGD